jgi:lipopolysaccharide transport system permease protein
MLTMVGFYLTPVFYSVRMVPEEYQFIYSLNPMAVIIRSYRDVVVRNSWPDFGDLLWMSVSSAVILAGTYWAFSRMSPRFPEDL